MPQPTATEPLTTEVYFAGTSRDNGGWPMREYGVVVTAGRVELVREEGFWSEDAARRAVPRVEASAQQVAL